MLGNPNIVCEPAISPEDLEELYRSWERDVVPKLDELARLRCKSWEDAIRDILF